MGAKSSEDTELNAQISIRRDSPRDCTYRIVRILIDEVEVTKLNFGESITIDVPPGLHTITADNTWTSRSLTLACEPRQRLQLATGNTAGGCAMTLLLTLGVSGMGVFVEPTQPNATED